MVPSRTDYDDDDDDAAMVDWFSVWSSEAPLGFCDLIGTRKV